MRLKRLCPATSAACGVVLCLFLGAAADSASAAVIYGLGDLPGGYFFSSIAAVSHDGRVAVGTSDDGAPASVYWTRDQGLVPIAASSGIVYRNLGVAGVSGDGTWVVGSGNGGAAFRWNRSTRAMESLDAPSPDAFTVAYSASGSGSVVVGEGGPVGAYRAFRWTPQTGPVRLADLPGPPHDGRAIDVSADGSVMVGNAVFNSAGNARPVQWSADGQISALDLPAGYRVGSAMAVSPNGSIVAGFVADELDRIVPVLWRQGAAPLVLDLPPGAVWAGASAVSDTGVVIGNAEVPGASEGRPFIWDAAHGSRLLQDALAADGATLPGWTLFSATDISADGQTIVGDAYTGRGEQQGYVAVLPEPTAPALAMLLSLPLLRRRQAAPPIP